MFPGHPTVHPAPPLSKLALYLGLTGAICHLSRLMMCGSSGGQRCWVWRGARGPKGVKYWGGTFNNGQATWRTPTEDLPSTNDLNEPRRHARTTTTRGASPPRPPSAPVLLCK